ncbi:MAG: AIPR family protein [Rhodanobacteraceae bacterium]|nr:AIPR family protein [Rhodanobacteraceae bacterium]
MEKQNDNWIKALAARDDLGQYADNAIGLFALALRFNVDDIHSVAAESVTDGTDDKKCDLIYLDKEEGVAVVAQCYSSQRAKASAPANKASDLNTAVAWLLQRPLDELPKRIISAAKELRDSIRAGEIRRFEIWYVHNLPESNNVRDELTTVEHTANTVISSLVGPSNVAISSLEIGSGRLEEWYKETLSPILVNEEIKFEVSSGFEIYENGWKAYVAPIQARQLYKLYRTYKTSLFSANVRDYLGSRKSDANINNGIKKTAQYEPENFWVFNNGITVLTHSFEERKEKGRTFLVIKGASIVNGAQTTGALGSLPKNPDQKVLVPARFVATSDAELVYNIIQYNNSQNKVTASDFRSTDRIQKRLRDEIEKIPNAKYEGGRRGGHKDVIERNRNLLPSYTVGQSLAAFNLEPIVAYNQKSEIWVNDKLYSRYFNDEANGANLVFAYGLLRAVEEKKRGLVARSKASSGLTSQEEELLDYFRHRGSTYLFVSAVSSCLEVFAGKKVSNSARVSFGQRVSPLESMQIWKEVVDIVSPFTQQLLDALNDGLKNAEKAQKAIGVFRSLVQATAGANADAYKKFSKQLAIAK